MRYPHVDVMTVIEYALNMFDSKVLFYLSNRVHLILNLFYFRHM